MKKILLMSLFLMLALLNAAMAQDRTISGTVLDKGTNTGLPGVTVSIKDMPGIGTNTDANGSYTLSLPPGATTLEFSFIGYRKIERNIGAESNISVTLETDTKQLGEVVVTAMGIERQERTVGYATTTVNAEEVTKGRSSSPMNALQGKVAGMNITTASGSPGASTKVIVRGYSSISGGNNPLYVIDGIPMSNTATNLTDVSSTLSRQQDFGSKPNDINPDDIESISVLKGAAATALYGSRAAHGVILITTKKGKASDKMTVDFSTSATFSSPLRVPSLQNQFGQGWNGHFDALENGSWGPKLDGKDRYWGNTIDGTRQIKPFSFVEDRFKDFYETGTNYINTVSLSGGNEKTNFFASYGNVREDGILPTENDSYNRNTLSLRAGTKGKKLGLSTNLNYVRKDASVVTAGQGTAGAGTTYQNIIQIPMDMSIVDFKDPNNKFNTNDYYFTPYAENPYWALEQNSNEYDENRMYGGVELTYDFTDWLKGIVRGGGDVSHAVIRDWTAPVTLTEGSPVLDNGGGNIPGGVDERTRFSRDLDLNAILTANNNITEDLRLSTLIGYNVNERYSKNSLAYSTDVIIPGFYNLSNTSMPVQASTAESLRRLYGVYGQAEFNFRDYLFLTARARNDWSSTLPIDDNSFFYPGADLSFVFTDVFTGLKGVMNYGKVRAAWGKTGNDANVYQILSVFAPASTGLAFGSIDFPIGGISGYEVGNQIGNPALTPEITREMEVGTNLEFFDSRIKLDLAYYDRLTDGQILAVPISPSSGFTSFVRNLGKIENKGIELGVTVTPIRTDDFNWDIRYVFSNNRNKVIELIDGLKEVSLTGTTSLPFVAVVGEPLGVFRVNDYVYSPDGKIVVAPTGLPLGSTEKITYGNSQADYLMGLTNTFNYKGLSLSVLFDYRKGGLMYSYTQRLSQFVGNTENTLYNDRKPFVVPNSVIQSGSNADGTPNYIENVIPVEEASIYDYWQPNQNPGIERTHLIDKTFLKLRELSLGYSIPSSLVERTPFSAVNVSIVGRNLLLWTPEENRIIDPEVSTFGNDLNGEYGEFGSGPTTRSLGASLRVTF